MEPPKNFLLINKPIGWTSFDVVGYIRKNLSAQGGPASGWKVGHAGTLDPFATGLLIVGIGREATKRLDEFKNLSKTYVATIRLGATSDTGDPTGKIHISRTTYPVTQNNLTIEQFNQTPTKSTVQSALPSFVGKQLQTPPMYSAKSVGGVRLYKLARQGKEVERQPNQIEILNIKLLEYSYPELKIEVVCSSGTYIRTLAEDIGKKLGTGAYCSELTRTAIGDYLLRDAKTPNELTSAI